MNLRNWEKNQIESNSIRNQNNCYKYTIKSFENRDTRLLETKSIKRDLVKISTDAKRRSNSGNVQ